MALSKPSVRKFMEGEKERLGFGDLKRNGYRILQARENEMIVLASTQA